MKSFNRIGVLRLIFILSATLLCSGAFADCGSIGFRPIRPPRKPVVIRDEARGLARLSKDAGAEAMNRAAQALDRFKPGELDYDPLEIRVHEPGQRAIILWNGVEEILLLSTDQSARQKAFVLEVIPLPAEPKLRLGSLETFEKAEKLVIKKKMWACAHGGARAELADVPEPAAEITFHEVMGPHEVTVAKVLDGGGFIGFVQEWIEENYHTPRAPIRPEFVEIIQSYIDRGFRWFVFDVIVLEPDVQTREPLEYRFKSDSIFYPMKISTLEQGETTVELLVFTDKRSLEFRGLSRDEMVIDPQADVSFDEIEELDERWKGFFYGTKSAVMNRWVIKGDITKFHEDILVK